MFGFLVRLLVNAIAVIVAVHFVPHVRFEGDWWQLLLLAAIIGVINAYIRPVVKILSLPLTLLTFGLIGFVINTALLMLAAAVSQSLTVNFTLAGWPPGKIDLDMIVAALLTSIVISVVSALASVVRFATPKL